MASLQLDPRTDNLCACFSIRRDGRLKRFYLSLGTTDRTLGTGKRTFAQDLVTDVEDAAHGAVPHLEVRTRIQKIPDVRVRDRAEKILNKAVEIGLGATMDAGSIEETITKWLQRQAGRVRKTTFNSYTKAVTRFLSFLEERSKLPLHRLTREMLEGFQEAETKITRASTAYLKIKTLRIFFKDAIIRNYINKDPSLGIKATLEESQNEGRRPFTVSQLKAIEGHCKDEWRGLFLFGLYTGQRLSDIDNLRWYHLKMECEEARWTVAFTTRKTGRQMDIPISTPLRDYIVEELESSDNVDDFLFPKAASKTANGTSGTLSNEFRKILKSAGIVETLVSKNPKKPKGRSAPREASIHSFHSLRHSAVSLMKNAGISPEIVRDIIGHESAAVSSIYTHISHEAKASALSAMPALGLSLKSTKNRALKQKTSVAKGRTKKGAKLNNAPINPTKEESCTTGSLDDLRY
ncbi:MAG: tyrosine-type recombinase/integrase [Chthoniobacterales bacterium]